MLAEVDLIMQAVQFTTSITRWLAGLYTEILPSGGIQKRGGEVMLHPILARGGQIPLPPPLNP